MYFDILSLYIYRHCSTINHYITSVFNCRQISTIGGIPPISRRFVVEFHRSARHLLLSVAIIERLRISATTSRVRSRISTKYYNWPDRQLAIHTLPAHNNRFPSSLWEFRVTYLFIITILDIKMNERDIGDSRWNDVFKDTDSAEYKIQDRREGTQNAIFWLLNRFYWIKKKNRQNVLKIFSSLIIKLSIN